MRGLRQEGVVIRALGPRPTRRSPGAWLVGLLALVCLQTAAAAAVDLSGDSRLDAKVALSLGHAMLDTVLQEAGKQASVGLRAGKDDRDWLSRELPVSVFVKDLPLRTAMERLAKLTGFTWSAVGEGEGRSYRLWQDQKAREVQASEVLARTAAENAERSKRGIANLDAYAKLSRATPKQLEQMAEEDPMGFLLATQPGLKSLTRLAAALSPDQKVLATTEDGVRLSYAKLPPALQEEVRSLISGFQELTRKLEPPRSEEQPQAETPPNLDRAELVFRAPRSGEISFPGAMSPFTGLFEITGIEGYRGMNDFPLVDTTSEVGKLLGRMLSQALQGMPQQNLNVMVEEQLGRLIAGSFGETPAVPSDPELLRKVKLELPEGSLTLADLLQALHKASGYGIVADDLPQPSMEVPRLGAGLGEEAPLYEVLSRLRGLCGLVYEKDGALLQLRDKDWARKREWLVPQEWLRRWEAKAKTEAGLGLEDLIEMSGLTLDQAGKGLRAVEALRSVSWALNESTLPVLRFLGSLTSQQRQSLESGEAVNLSAFTPEQRALLLEGWRKDRNARSGGGSPEGPLLRGGTVTLEPSGPPGPDGKPAPLASRDYVALKVEARQMGPEGQESTSTATLRVFVPRPPPKTLPSPARPQSEGTQKP